MALRNALEHAIVLPTARPEAVFGFLKNSIRKSLVASGIPKTVATVHLTERTESFTDTLGTECFALPSMRV